MGNATVPRAVRQRRDGRRRRAGGLAALALLAAVVVPVAPGAPVPEAAAVGLPSGIQTGFQIDGDKTGATPPETFDWADILQPPPTETQTPSFVPTAPYTTASGLQSSGVFAGAFSWDNGSFADSCGSGDDQTANASGGSQNMNTNPWVAAPTHIGPGGGDLCSAGYAAEALTDDAGERTFILYGYFTRRTGGNATADVSTLFEGPEPGRCDDLLLDAHFPAAQRVFYEWQPASGDGCANPDGTGTWVATGRDVDFVVAAGQRTEGPPIGNQQENTFGEYAMNLTASGLFRDDVCSTYAVSTVMTRSSDSFSANVIDFLDDPSSEPLEISNCGTLTVTKETPAGESGDEFEFSITNDSSEGIVVPPDQGSLDGTVRSGQTVTYENVLGSSRLHLAETAPPSPWELVRAECAYTDQTGQKHTVDVTDPSTPFTLLPDGRTDCVLTNDAALLTVTKQTLPEGSEQEFDFDIGPDHAETLGDGESVTVAVPAGEALEIEETAVDGWMAPEVECTDGTDETDGTVTVTPVLGENLACTFTNTQLATVTIEKSTPVENAGTDFDFSWGGTTEIEDFTLTPAAVEGATVAVDSQEFSVPPGEYSVTEDVPEDFLLETLTCRDVGGQRDIPREEWPTASFTAEPGVQLICTFVDVRQVTTLRVEKATTPMAEWDQDFPVTVAGPGGFENASFPLNTDPTADADWKWAATEVPAGTYTITEEQLPGWTVDSVACTQDGDAISVQTQGGVTTVDVPAGSVVTCRYTNRAELAEATVTKTAAGIAPGFPWSFNLSLSPVPGTSTTVDGAGPGSDSASWDELLPGQRYVLTEEEQPGWDMGAITCTDLEDLDEDPLTVTFDAEVGQQLECAMTNTAQPSSVVMRKVSTGLSADYPWSFDVQISPLPEGTSNPTTVSGTGQSAVTVGWDNLVPGQTYDLTEIDLPDEVTQRLEECTGAEVEQIADGFRFTAPLAGEVSCSLTNFVAAVPATLTKTSTDGDGNFVFTLAELDGGDTLDVPITTVGGTGSADLELVPGVRYALNEADQTGWIEQPITCRRTPAGDGTPIDLDVTDFAVEVGDTVSCEAVNALAPGTVNFTKTVAGVTGDYEWSFPLTLTPAGEDPLELDVQGTGPGASSVAWTDLDPGVYTLEEGGTQGWDAGPITCGLDETGDEEPFTPGFQILLEAGESYSCEASNTAQPPTVTIAKSAAGIGDDFPWSFDFTLSPAPEGQDATVALAGTGPGAGDAPHTWTDLSPGAVYSLIEADPGPGWTSSGVVCDDGSGTTIDGARIVAAPGAEYTCEAVNTAPPVTGSITKTSVGGDGEFTFLLDTVPSSGAPTPVPVTTSGGTGTADLPTLLPGNTYILTEDVPDGWRQTGELTCTRTPDGGDPVPLDLTGFEVEAGDDVACTAENTADGRVVLHKTVRGTGDAPQDFAFTSNIEGHEELTVEGVVEGEPATETVMEGVAPGEDYFLEEATDGGDPAMLVEDLSCTYAGETHPGTPEDRENRRIGFEVLPGQTTECSFTNAVEGTLTLVKQSDPVGFDQDFDFTAEGPSIEGTEAIVLNPGVDGGARTWSGLLGGTYTLTEGDLTPGWSLDAADGATSCDAAEGAWNLDPQARSIDVTIQPGDAVTCVFTNRAESASVSVTKSAEGLADGTPWEFPLTLSPSEGVTPGGTQTASGTAPDTATVVWQELTPGITYTLAEAATDGWTSGGVECAGTPDASPDDGFQFVAGVGQELSCTLENTAAPATVTATKTVSGVADGLEWAFGVTLTPPGEPEGTRSLTGTGNTTSEPVSWDELVPGTTYTLAEDTPEGWAAGEFVCAADDPLEDADSEAAGFQFVATPGLSLGCDVENTAAAASVSFEKTVSGVADDLAWSFGVTLDPEADPRGMQEVDGTGDATSEPVSWADLVPGTAYTLSEELPDGWTAGDVTCEGAEDVESSPATVTFTPGSGDVVTCAATNTAVPAEVSVTKTVSGVADGLAWSFDVTLTSPGGAERTQVLTGAGNETSDPASWDGLVPGTTYTLAEDPPDGWTGGEVVCDGVEDADTEVAGFQFVATPGQILRCDVANAAAAADVSVTKTVSGAADSLDWAFDVTLTPPGEAEGTRSLTGTGNTTSDPASWEELVPGTTYTLAEDLPAGWSGGEPACQVDDDPLEDADPDTAGLQFSPGPGQSVSCEITNTAVQASLSATKTVDGVAGGRGWSFALTLDPSAEPGGTQTVTGIGNETSEPAAWEGLVPGAAYTLTEATSEAGWTQGGFVCRVGDADEGEPVEDADDAAGFQLVPAPGGSYFCDVVNTRDPATGTITKTALGGDGDFAFVLTPEGQPEQTITVSTSGGSGTAELPPLLPDTLYSLVEGPADGWVSSEELACTVTPEDGGETTLIADLSAFSVEPGDVLDCAATNARPGSIVVVKSVDGADAEFGFTGSWLDPEDFTITTSGGTGARTFDDVAPGVHTLSEVARDGYEGTGLVCADGAAGGDESTVDGLDATIALDPGETVTCTYSNAAWGVLVVDKATAPASEQEFGFAWGPVGGEQERFTLTDADEPFTTEPLAPGTYTVSEGAADEWRLESLTCTGSSGEPVVDGATAVVDVRVGDTVLCRFSNVPATADPGLPPEAGPEPGRGQGDTPLPVTGLWAGIAGLAALLLLSGVVLVLVRRRS